MQQPWPTHGGFLSHGGSRVAPNHARLQHFSTETSFGDPPFQETPKWREQRNSGMYRVMAKIDDQQKRGMQSTHITFGKGISASMI